MIAWRIRSDLRPHLLPESSDLLRHQLRRVGFEFVDGITHIVRTPRAIAPITSIAVDQMGQGLVLVLALVVFRERFGTGVGSFSWLIGAGGVGVFLGLATVGLLDRRFSRERIVAFSFAIGGVALLLVALFLNRWSALLASFVVGLTFAWKKVPIDTMVQEAVPDGLRGRVFAVYDVAYNLARLMAALLAVVLLPAIGENGSAAVVGIVFLLWVPVLPRWLRNVPEIVVRVDADGEPEQVQWGGVSEPVTVLEAQGSGRWRVRLADGTVLAIGTPRRRPVGDRRGDRALGEPPIERNVDVERREVAGLQERGDGVGHGRHGDPGQATPTLTRCAPASKISATVNPGSPSTLTGRETAEHTARISSTVARPGAYSTSAPAAS